MNLWAYLSASPFGAVVLVFALGRALAAVVAVFRARRPVRVRLMVLCPECGREHAAHPLLENAEAGE